MFYLYTGYQKLNITTNIKRKLPLTFNALKQPTILQLKVQYIRRNKKICMVPVTRRFLFSRPYTFSHLSKKTNWCNF